MRRETRAVLLVLVGAALLHLSLFSDLCLRYVRATLRPYLVTTGALLVLLGLASALAVLRALRGGHDDHEHGRAPDPEHDDGHGHGPGGPRIAWLLVLPVAAVFLVAPQALGAYTAQRTAATPVRPATADTGFPALAAGDPLVMTVNYFDIRALWDTSKSLQGRRVQLTGFATPDPAGGWDLTRLTITCCAADARASKVRVTGAAAPREGTWVRVVGSWQPPATPTPSDDDTDPPIPQLTAQQLTEIPQPADPYE
ncbi:TIGR03943 family putative permease subunit [Kitasatospora sp. NPDC052896]|uniref:TIGR03943 family putative permease subunit n=1 Tax=Kitasatospora sp. NPDC052896 TaxID=3364061 RepID=UPI0037C86D1E